ncbi:MAG: ImmA/IrrE family metallo-endopeptidase [Firmicutes bacterium]|nr:ImmA/IrrE family metallo-endopeptidase [Bacillota bacterium]
MVRQASRFTDALQAAWLFTSLAQLNWLPIDPSSIYRKFRDTCLLLDSAQAAEVIGNGHPLVEAVRRPNNDAYTFFSHDRSMYVTIFNEKRYPARIRWTLAHEIGHIVLGHVQRYEAYCIHGGLEPNKHRALERQANDFAAELLAPMYIIRRLKLSEPSDLSRVFGLSTEAATNRVADLRRKGDKPVYDGGRGFLQAQYAEFLSPVALCSNQFSNGLPVHLASYAERVVNDRMQQHSSVDTNENGRFLACPQCGNKDFADDANYCRLCGIPLYNHCTALETTFVVQCGEVNRGDARYCEFCGAETMLFSKGLLVSWNGTTADNHTNDDAWDGVPFLST